SRAAGASGLEPAVRLVRYPLCANLLRSDLRVLSARGGLQLRTIGRIDAVAARCRLAVDEGSIFARRCVAIIAKEVHRFVIAENDDDLATFAWRFLLQLLKAADDLQ